MFKNITLIENSVMIIRIIKIYNYLLSFRNYIYIEANNVPMKKILLFTILGILTSCCGNHSEEETVHDVKILSDQDEQEDKDLASIKVESDYDLSTVEAKDRKEFKENLAKIEKEHGVQWDFCTCVMKNDSIDKAIKDPATTDEDFDVLLLRLDEVEQKCKAFLSQSANATPEERSEHQDKVRKCLKANGSLP